MSKEEKDISEVELALLHTAIEHVVSQGLSQFGVAIAEAADIFDKSGDERAKVLEDVLTKAITDVADGIKPILETIPGVIMPTLSELKQMIADAQAEQDFLMLVKTGDPVMH